MKSITITLLALLACVPAQGMQQRIAASVLKFPKLTTATYVVIPTALVVAHGVFKKDNPAVESHWKKNFLPKP